MSFLSVGPSRSFLWPKFSHVFSLRERHRPGDCRLCAPGALQESFAALENEAGSSVSGLVEGSKPLKGIPFWVGD